MGRTADEHRNLVHDLDEAIACSLLDVHYQPFFGLREPGLRGFEALARWTHPSRGDVPSSIFVPVAEMSDQIERLGIWVLEEACSAACAWAEPVSVAVNVSPVQLRVAGFTRQVADILSETGLAPKRLELEVTENVLIGDTDGVIAKLQDLKSLGVRVALDDFGTGFSSLSYLRRLPVDKVKIDQFFIRTMLDDKVSDAIVAAIIVIGGLLGVTVTGEGVETAGQLDHLRQAGCDEAQGFFLGAPSPMTADILSAVPS